MVILKKHNKRSQQEKLLKIESLCILRYIPVIIAGHYRRVSMPKLHPPQFLMFIALIAASTAHAAEPSSTYFRDWLLCGPIILDGPEPISGTTHHLRGFDRNYFEAQGEEGSIRPQAGDSVVFPGGETTWKAWESTEDSVDLNEAVSRTDEVLAYAYTTFKAKKDQVAVLALGSNDGCRAWLNGELIFDHPAVRGLILDAERVADTPELLARVDMVRIPLLYLKCKRMPRQALRDGSYVRLLEIKEREGITRFAEEGATYWKRFTDMMESLREE